MNIPVGIDLGSWNARIATYDEGLDHSVMVYNQDGHRTTRAAVVVDDNVDSGPNADTVDVLDLIREQGGVDNDNSIDENTKNCEKISNFLKQILGLACENRHVPMDRLRVVTSLAYGNNNNDSKDPSSLPPSRISSVLKSCLDGDSCIGFCYEPIATCLAYDPSPELKHLLVVDGGASGLKVSLVKQIPLSASSESESTTTDVIDPTSEASSSSQPAVVWSIQHHETTPDVSGRHLIDQMGIFVSSQFEMKHRFPKGEVWSSRKVKRKLYKACEPGLLTLYQSNNVTIHVDGLYEGMDCQVTISKPRWEMTTSKLANSAKDLIKKVIADSGIETIDAVLLSGNLHSWLRPLVESALKSSLKCPTTSFKNIIKTPSFDPSEAIALGCAKQAYCKLSNDDDDDDDDSDSDKAAAEAASQARLLDPQQVVTVSPVSIGISGTTLGNDNGEEEKQSDCDASPTLLIARGTPLPAVGSFKSGGDAAAGNNNKNIGFPLTVWQLEPTKKQLATLEGSGSSTSTTSVRVQLTKAGQLTIAAGGQHVTIGG